MKNDNNNKSDKNNSKKNSLKDIPAAACQCCGGWTSHGGMSQHANSTVPVLNRTGCFCIGR